jgi:hypothetical protein
MALSSYAPRLRTALVLCGAGTAGAYHAGVLRALAESGVKIDVIAAQGAGSIGALTGAVDGGAPFWADDGPWTQPALQQSYRWRRSLRLAVLALASAAVIVLSPLLVILLATVVYALGMLASLASFPEISARLIGLYSHVLGWLFDPPILPTIVPRLVVLAFVAVLAVLVLPAWQARRQRRTRRRSRGLWLWHLLSHPLDERQPEEFARGVLRTLTQADGRGQTGDADLGRRYVELVSENFGQPGFRELLLGVHDIDGRRDVVLGVVSPQWQSAFMTRRVGAGPREAEAIDVTGGGDDERGLVADALLASLRIPMVSASHDVELPLAGYWRGERHRWCDRPELTTRLIDEVARIGVEQVILVAPAPPAALPHDLRSRAADLRDRAGETLRSMESAAFQEGWSAAASRFSGVFAIRPDHNPIGPFSFDGAYDEASDRRRSLPELIRQGYSDAYRQFIEPVVATGERVDP